MGGWRCGRCERERLAGGEHKATEAGHILFWVSACYLDTLRL